jgi:MscS family membrane protein
MFDGTALRRFAAFEGSALNVEIFAYVDTSDWNEFLAIQEDINLRILDILEKAGTGLAFPSRLYHAQDGRLKAERQEAAEKQVREWAAAHTLPFPKFAEDYRKQVTDTSIFCPRARPERSNERRLPSASNWAGPSCNAGRCAGSVI